MDGGVRTRNPQHPSLWSTRSSLLFVQDLVVSKAFNGGGATTIPDNMITFRVTTTHSFKIIKINLKLFCTNYGFINCGLRPRWNKAMYVIRMASSTEAIPAEYTNITSLVLATKLRTENSVPSVPCISHTFMTSDFICYSTS